jgi:hypothetical protein
MPALPACSCALGTDGDTLWPLLADTIWSGITAPLDLYPADPHTAPHVFTGSFDYHSCIHAHWAFLNIARTVGDATRAASGLGRLPESVLSSEWSFMESITQSTRISSYRWGWFALLLSEISQHTGRNTLGLRALRGQVERKLCDWLLANQGDSTFIDTGWHWSWLFAFLLLQLSDPITPTVVSQMTLMYTTTVDGQRTNWHMRAAVGGEFMFLPCIVETVDLLRRRAPWLTAAMLTSTFFAAGSAVGGLGAAGLAPGHAVGERITHAWPVAVLARTDPAMCTLLNGFVHDWLAHPENWQYRLSATEPTATATARFTNNSHWTPQFLWMALRLRCPP